METNVIKYSNDRFERVWTSLMVNDLINELDQTLTSGEVHEYNQTAWMGRGCFKPNDGKYVFLKGVGPTDGSEIFRQIMDKFWQGRSPIGKGGCVRLQTNDFPILIEYYYKSEKEIEVFDPRPEGYSIYGAVLREAIISEYLYGKNFYIPQPLAIYKTKLLAEWEDGNNEQMAQYCKKAFVDTMNLPSDITVNLSKVQYEDCKAGLFVRLFDSELRLQEVVEVYIHHEDRLKSLSDELDVKARNEGWENWTQKFEHGMIRNLVMFLKYGVIHSNLQTHYQNFSLNGEICDWDAAIIHKSFPCADEFRNLLERADQHYLADMMRFYHDDEDFHSDYNTFAIQQIYAIINSCMFAENIRCFAAGNNCTCLDDLRFEQNVVDQLVTAADQDCLEKLLKLTEVSNDCKYVYKIVGKTSILGWNCYLRDKDYSKHLCTESDRSAIINDVKNMMLLIKNAINGRKYDSSNNGT